MSSKEKNWWIGKKTLGILTLNQGLLGKSSWLKFVVLFEVFIMYFFVLLFCFSCFNNFSVSKKEKKRCEKQGQVPYSEDKCHLEKNQRQ